MWKTFFLTAPVLKVFDKIVPRPSRYPALRDAGCLVFASAVVRYATLWFAHPGPNPIFDERPYYLMAQAMAGNLERIPFLHYNPPLWPFVLSWWVRLTESLFALRLFPIFFGSLNTGLVYYLGTRCFNRKTGLIAGIIHLFCPELIFFHHTLMAETLLETTIILASVALFCSEKGPNRARNWTLAAALLGIGLLCKHFAIVALAGLGGVLLARARKPKLLLPLLGLSFVLVPIIYFVWLSTRGRDGLMIFNAPLVNARTWHTAGKGARPIGPQGRPQELQRYQGLMRGVRPATFVQLTWQSYSSLWSPIEHLAGRGDLFRRYQMSHFAARRVVIVHCVFFLLLFTAGVAGLCFSPPSAFRLYAIFILSILSGLSMFFFLFTRYRIAFLFLLILFAAKVFSMKSKSLSNVARPRLAAFAAIMLLQALIIAKKIPAFLAGLGVFLN